jgi:iron complex transport system ATP-binding protein
VLRADAVSFAYETAEVLRDVSVDIASAGLTGVLGPNGSGKTTLLRLLGGLRAPSAGQVTLDDVNLSTLSRGMLARRMATVPQETTMAFDYSVLEVVLMGRYPHLATFAIEGPTDLEYAARALAATGTSDLAARSFTTLSGGEKQRVVIASALAQLSAASDAEAGSHVLLLDEPTASLDLAYQLEIASLIRQLNARGITIVVSTHDLNLAASVCRDLVLLRDGRVLASGPTREVLTEDMVRSVYGVEAQVTRHPTTGHALVIPLARSHTPTS